MPELPEVSVVAVSREEEVLMTVLGILVLVLVGGSATAILDVEAPEGIVVVALMLEFGIFVELDDALSEEQGGEAVVDESMWSESGTSLLIELDEVVALRYLE